VDADGMYIVKPPETLWERTLNYEGKALPDGFRFSSDTNGKWLDVEGIRELVAPFEGPASEATTPSRFGGHGTA